MKTYLDRHLFNWPFFQDSLGKLVTER